MCTILRSKSQHISDYNPIIKIAGDNTDAESRNNHFFLRVAQYWLSMIFVQRIFLVLQMKYIVPVELLHVLIDKGVGWEVGCNPVWAPGLNTNLQNETWSLIPQNHYQVSSQHHESDGQLLIESGSDAPELQWTSIIGVYLTPQPDQNATKLPQDLDHLIKIALWQNWPATLNQPMNAT